METNTAITERDVIAFIKQQDTATILQWCIINVGAKMHEMNADNLNSSIRLEKLGVKVVAQITLEPLPPPRPTKSNAKTPGFISG